MTPAGEAPDYRLLFELHPHPVLVYDVATLRLLAVNPATTAVYGWSRDELLGMSVADLRPPEEVARLEAALAGQGAAPGPCRAVWRHRRKDGGELLVEVTSQPLEFEGRAARLAVAVDVTEAERARAALREREGLLSSALRLGDMGSWSMDIEVGRLEWPPETCRLFGLEPGAFPGTFEAFLELVLPEDRPTLLRAIEAARDTGALEVEYRIRRPDGAVRWILERGATELDARGVERRRLGMVLDVTAHREVEAALRVHEERLRLLARATNDAIWEWELATGRVTWNDGLAALTGYLAGEVEPTADWWKDHVHPEDRGRVVAGIHAVIDGATSQWADEYRFARRDGGWAWVYDRGHVLRDAAGRGVLMIGGMTDLTERRRAEERLAEQAALLDLASDAIAVRDMAHGVRFWSRGAESLYGWTAEEARAGSVSARLREAPEATAAALAHALEHGAWSGELEHVTKDGRAVTVLARWTLVRDARGAPAAILAIDTDVTEKKRLEQHFRRAQRLESLGVLAAGIAHDLNNVLTPILMSSELLQEEVRGERARGLLAALRTSATRGADLIRQVLAFGRGGEGRRARVDLAQLARDVQQMARETFPRNVTLTVDAPPDLWPVTANGTQLHQVLVNLCVNARDAMPEGGTITLALENTTLDEIYAGMNVLARPGPYVLLRIEDTGHGMTPDVLERLFEPFFTTKEPGRGTGLGLPVSFGIVREHGGFMNVYSEPGKGSRFKVYLPADASARMAEEVAVERSALPRGAGELILVVDDEEAVREVTRTALERFGYRVLLAAHGAEGVALYVQRRGEVAAVLTDMSMPIMDGPAMIVALKSLDPEVRIVGSSGLSSNGKVAKAVGAGVEHFVTKPYTAQALLTTLRRVLDGAPPAAQAGPVEAGAQVGAGRQAPRTILVVEDAPEVLDLAEQVLRSAGHTVLAARSGEEALTLLEGPGAAVDLVLTDVELRGAPGDPGRRPGSRGRGMSGHDLAREAARRRPDLAWVVMSGGAALEHTGDLPPSRVLRKPFSVAELLDAVERPTGG